MYTKTKKKKKPFYVHNCSGQIEYSQRTAWTTIGILCAILIPVIACAAAIFVCLRRNQQQQGSSTKSWHFSDRGSINNDSFAIRQTTPLKSSYERTLSPTSDSSSNISGTARKRRTYDGVYYTHEPLPNRPDINFEEKDWDLKDPKSTSESDSTFESMKKPESPSKESDV